MKLSPLHARVQTEIRTRRLFNRSERLLIGVSGGQDSLCLLKLLGDLSVRWDWQIYVVHCDHRWSEDETACAQFLQDWIRQLGLPGLVECVIETVESVTRDENRARQWRYRVFAHWARQWNCQAVVTGHTGSDRAETTVYNLLRGSGAEGLASLDWIRPLDRTIPQSPRLVRPLLGVWRHETETFCQDYQLPVWPDLSNQDLSHRRNRIRQELIPYLRQHFNPQVEVALSHTAAILGAEHEVVVTLARTCWEQSYRPDPPRLDRLRLRQAPVAVQREVLRMLLIRFLSSTPGFDQVELLKQLVSAPRKSRTPPFCGGVWAEVVDDAIVLHTFDE